MKSPTVPKPAGGCAPLARPQGPTSPAGPSVGSGRYVLGSDSKITVFSSFAYQASGYRAPGWSELPVREATPRPKARAVEGRLADARFCLFFTHKTDPPGPQSISVTLGTRRRAPRRVRMLPAGSHSPPRSGGCPPGSSVATDGDSGFAQWDSNFTVSTVNLLSWLRVNSIQFNFVTYVP